MIKKLSTIKSLAVFKDFSWDKHLKSKNFEQINILYGRNYSGKTTLSRIIRALETGIISSNYSEPQFSVSWKDDNIKDSNVTDLQGHAKTIRVFNEDFVRENLNFLTDTSNSQGQVKAFAVIGADNVKIENEIKVIEVELGNSEDGKETGLYAQLKTAQREQMTAATNHLTANDALQKKKTDKATDRKNGIKYRSDIFGDQNYTIAKLDADIKDVLKTKYILIDDKKRQDLEHSLKESAKAEIPILTSLSLDIQTLSGKVKEIVERKIGGSEKIQELIRDFTLNEWVKKGYNFHKDKREICAFCGSSISSKRWNILEKHFDEETERLEKEITQLIEKINVHKQAVANGFNISESLFYAKFQTDIKDLIAEYKIAVSQYCAQLDTLIQQLEKRKQAITIDFTFSAPENTSSAIEAAFSKYENIRSQSNTYTSELSNAKNETQKTLRLHEVKSFVDTIKYVEETKKIDELKIALQETKAVVQKVQTYINDKLQSIEELKRQLNDEEKGAIKVNEYLNHFFGHKFLTLKASESAESKQIRFKVMRGEQEAFNLSEGECSLIAFCYFMAKLNDVGTSGKQPIIWIDDPISSLDGNHIFFVYSLLRAEIVDKKKFEQLFVSTHNLEFLKYLKRLYVKNCDYQKAWLIVEQEGDSSVIKTMPKYLKEYITEFNYLFHQIYKCAQAICPDDDNYAIFYNFANNARKFLEIYLYYKYPDEKISEEEKMSRLFGDKVVTFLTDRVNNEYSHLSGAFERGAMPIDIPEMKSVAQEILKTIENTDKAQYEALIESISENRQKEKTLNIKKSYINKLL
jgi:wobble nucleotide-excising tRNase